MSKSWTFIAVVASIVLGTLINSYWYKWERERSGAEALVVSQAVSAAASAPAQVASPPRPEASVGLSSGVRVFEDPETGCQYLPTHFDKFIVPRLNSYGNPKCRNRAS